VVFDPDIEYVRQAVKSPAVTAFLVAAKFTIPVFMVTGLKIARGASAESAATRAAKAHLGLSGKVPGVATIGSAADAAKSKYTSTSFEGSTDFILAFRVRRVRYKDGNLEQKIYTRGVSMMDGSWYRSNDNGPEVLGLDEDQDADLSQLDPYSERSVVEDEGLQWLVPSGKKECEQ